MKIIIKPVFAWYDLWVGFYWDKLRKRLYFFPIPMLGLYVQFGIVHALVAAADMLSESPKKP